MNTARGARGAVRARSALLVRSLAAVVVAAGLTLGGAAGGFLVAPVDAASPDLTMVATARYEVQPTKHRVRVTVALTATSHTVDTVIRRYYVDHGFLAVLPGTSAFKVVAVDSKAKPTVRASRHHRARAARRRSG